jgi:putative transposase
LLRASRNHVDKRTPPYQDRVVTTLSSITHPGWPASENFFQNGLESGLFEDGRIKKQRFTEEQIIAVLKEQEAGAKAADLCRKHGISEATFYNWKAKYGGVEVSEANRLKALG